MKTPLSIRQFGGYLWRLADLVQAAESRRSFRAKAYRSAVWALDSLTGVDAADEELLSTPGIGPGVTSLFNEYRSTGEIEQLRHLDDAYPEEVALIRRLPRMRPVLLEELRDLGVETRRDLLGAIDTGAAGTLKGVGPQTLELWTRIIELTPVAGAVPAYDAWVETRALSTHLARHTGSEVHASGAVRRVEEWVNHVDLVAVTDDFAAVSGFLEETAVLRESSASGNVVTGATHSGLKVAVHLTGEEAFGSTLFATTGPPEHVESVGPSATSHPNEEEIYEASRLPWIPPPARVLDLESASLVVSTTEIRGDLHLHSEASPDGRMSLEAIVREAAARGYEYVLITDHTKGLRFGGLTEEDIAVQADLVASVRDRFPEVSVFHGAELNIDADGGLDINDAALSLLDFAVAGVHSHFGLDRVAQTDRVVRALSHPVVKVLAHPFGRRIGRRPPLDLEMEAVIDAAVAGEVALETNGHRDRLDLGSDWLATAAASGALFAANSDAHRLDEMANLSNSVASLQRAGITSERVVNTWEVRRLAQWSRGG